MVTGAASGIGAALTRRWAAAGMAIVAADVATPQLERVVDELVAGGADVVGVPTDVVFHKSTALPEGAKLVVLPGGFSYGDYLRAGAIARFAPVMAAVREFIDRGGFVLGICNGFQILTEAGLLPGALTRNAHLRFECRDVTVRVDPPQLCEVDGDVLSEASEIRFVLQPSALVLRVGDDD